MKGKTHIRCQSIYARDAKAHHRMARHHKAGHEAHIDSVCREAGPSGVCVKKGPQTEAFVI